MSLFSAYDPLSPKVFSPLNITVFDRFDTDIENSAHLLYIS